MVASSQSMRWWVAGVLWLAATSGCRPSTPTPPVATKPTGAGSTSVAARPLSAEKKAQIDTFCAACHLNPRADYFPKHHWHDEVDRAFGFWRDSGRTDLPVPAMADVVRYFQDRAPERLAFEPPAVSDRAFAVRFERETLDPVEADQRPGVANVRWSSVERDAPPVLVCCDMRQGEVRIVDPRSSPPRASTIAKLRHPCRSEVVDLDGDGLLDLLVADLGSFDARDHREGRVVWLRQTPAGTWIPIEMIAGIGRVADVRAADFDGDGDLDLVVAEFGWHKTGGVFWLEAIDLAADPPKLARHDIDSRPGAIHLPIVDFNADGRPDLLALMSQDYEEILLWINQGDGTFRKELVGERQDPAFGSSGMELVDLDHDGDLDILYTNGDTFDSHLAKPYHGVQWLENTGTLPFTMHRLADMIGAYRAVAADLDRDGDLDIVLAGYLPSELVDKPQLDQFDSLVILEQTKPGQYVRHRLTQGAFEHAALEVADVDDDGDLDLVLGVSPSQSHAQAARLILWRNQGPSGGAR